MISSFSDMSCIALGFLGLGPGVQGSVVYGSIWTQPLWRIVIACGLLGGFLMNSKMVIWMSLFLSWPTLLKWAATGLSRSPLLMSPKWPVNLSLKRSSVWPTYCMLHALHVIA